jgi:hypothetical protein
VKKGNTMLPQNLIIQFWQEVADDLEKSHRLTRESARRAIDAFISLAEKQHFLDAVYHRNANAVAATIAGGVHEPGFLSDCLQALQAKKIKSKKKKELVKQ